MMCEFSNSRILVLLVALLALCPLGLDGDMKALAQDVGEDDEPNVPVCINEIMASNSTATAVLFHRANSSNVSSI